MGGALADRFGGIRVTLVNFILMAIFAVLLFFTLPGANANGVFLAFWHLYDAVSDRRIRQRLDISDDRGDLPQTDYRPGDQRWRQ